MQIISYKQIRLYFVIAGLFAALGVVPTTNAWAVTYDMYRIDNPRGAFCTALAGACASVDDMVGGFFQNPAAMAPDTDDFDFDFDFDYNPNNKNREPGMPKSVSVQQRAFMGGLGFRKWRLGIGVSYWARTVVQADRITYYGVNSDGTINRDSILATVNYEETGKMSLFRIPVGFRVFDGFTVGATYIRYEYKDDIKVNNFSSSQGNEQATHDRFAAGFQFKIGKSFRWGTWYQQRLKHSVDHSFEALFGIRLRETQNLHYPDMIANGFSIMPWEDKRAVLFDLNIISSTYQGKLKEGNPVYGALSPEVFKNKGRKTVYEPHLAWTSPFTKGSRGTYTIGAYYENSRWESVGGRPHAVVGLMYDVSLFQGIVALDVAKEFFDLQISIR